MKATKSMTTRTAMFAAACALSLAAAGCSSELFPPTPDAYSVIFRLEVADARAPGRVAWLATYEKDGKVARFGIEMTPEPRGTELPTFTQCALIRDPGSDASVLLEDLSRVLDGRVPAPGPGVAVLEVSAALLGRELSRGGSGNVIAGAYGTEPKGSWISTKLFLGEGEGEVFLNLDPVGGYGEFSTKDSTYGNDVLRELGRLFQGELSAQAATIEAEAPEAPAPSVKAAPPRPPASTLSEREVARIDSLIEQARPGASQGARMKALDQLARIGPGAQNSIPVVLEALEDEDPLIRGGALRALPSLRPEPATGIAAVTPLLRDSYEDNQIEAANALADFGETTTAVAHLMVHLPGRGRVRAAAGLSRLGPAASVAVPLLSEMLENRRNRDEGYAACRALAAIGRDAESALPALRKAAADPDEYVQKAAAHAIREIEGR